MINYKFNDDFKSNIILENTQKKTQNELITLLSNL